jgi:hypothetical protein
MNCIFDLVSIFLLPKSNAPPIVTIFYLLYHIYRSKPCKFCTILFLIILILTSIFKDSDNCFMSDWLGISSSSIELEFLNNLELSIDDLQFDRKSNRLCFSPIQSNWNYIRAIVLFLIQPRKDDLKSLIIN